MASFLLQKGSSALKVGTSIRTQLYAFLTLTAVLCVSVVILSIVSTQEVIQSTHTFFDCNSSLSSFYTAIDEMDSAARDWVYSGSDADYQLYLQAAKPPAVNWIRSALMAIRNWPGGSDCWKS